jgi:hypothetical protein
MCCCRDLLYVTLLISTAGCRSEGKGPPPNSTVAATTQLSTLSQEFAVSIPVDAMVLGVKRESGIDDLVRVKLLIPTGSRDQFVAGLPFALDKLRPGVGRLGSDDGFWNPHATPQLSRRRKVDTTARNVPAGPRLGADPAPV